MGEIIVFPKLDGTRNAMDMEMNEAKDKPKDYVEASVFQARAVRDCIDNGMRLINPDELSRVAGSLHEISEEWDRSGRCSRAAQAKALTGDNWDPVDSTKRLYKYMLPPGSAADQEKRRQHLTKRARAYLEAIKKLAAAAGEDVDWLTARVFRGTRFIGAPQIDQTDDHLVRTEKLLRTLATSVAREERLDRYFSLLNRYPLKFDIEQQRFEHASSCSMERGPLFDGFGPHLEDLAPAPNCLISRKPLSKKVLGTLRLYRKPFWTGVYGVKGMYPDTTDDIFEICALPVAARIYRDIRLCVAPWLRESDFAPVFETRYSLSATTNAALSPEAQAWVENQGIATVNWNGGEIELMPIYVLNEFEDYGFSARYTSFLPDSGWNPEDFSMDEKDPEFSELWWVRYGEVSPATLNMFLSEDPVESDVPMMRDLDRALTTWPPRTIGGLVEHDLLTNPDSGIEECIRASARSLSKKLETAVNEARQHIDDAAESTIARWRDVKRS